MSFLLLAGRIAVAAAAGWHGRYLFWFLGFKPAFAADESRDFKSLDIRARNCGVCYCLSSSNRCQQENNLITELVRY